MKRPSSTRKQLARAEVNRKKAQEKLASKLKTLELREAMPTDLPLASAAQGRLSSTPAASPTTVSKRPNSLRTPPARREVTTLFSVTGSARYMASETMCWPL